MAAFGFGILIGGVIVLVTGLFWDSPVMQGFGIFGFLIGGFLVAVGMGAFS